MFHWIGESAIIQRFAEKQLLDIGKTHPSKESQAQSADKKGCQEQSPCSTPAASRILMGFIAGR